MTNFWHRLPRPMIALAPMDGVTDAPFRYIAARHGRPDILFTEFTNVEGLARNAALMLDDFLFSEIERPVVAQIYGSEPDSFYKIAIVVCALGFDGIDINMGCPARKVAARGCGAGLIRTPPLAKEIIRAVKRGVSDWVDGKNIQDLGLKQRMLKRIEEMNRRRPPEFHSSTKRLPLPVSVKTRIGYDSVVVEDWVRHLLEESPVAITLHGRTLKQMYTGQADWEAIGRAAEIVHQTPTLILGNGDLQTENDILQKVRSSGVDGVLLGRGSMGNPWIFSCRERIRQALREGRKDLPADPEVPPQVRFAVLLEHARCFEDIKGQQRFSVMRKHFGCYCRGLPRAAELRNRMCQTRSSSEVEQILQDYRGQFPHVFSAASE